MASGIIREVVAMVTPPQVAHHNSVASAPVSHSYVFTPLLSLLLTICLCLVLIQGISGLGFWFGLAWTGGSENEGVCHTSLMT